MASIYRSTEVRRLKIALPPTRLLFLFKWISGNTLPFEIQNLAWFQEYNNEAHLVLQMPTSIKKPARIECH